VRELFKHSFRTVKKWGMQKFILGNDFVMIWSILESTFWTTVTYLMLQIKWVCDKCKMNLLYKQLLYWVFQDVVVYFYDFVRVFAHFLPVKINPERNLMNSREDKLRCEWNLFSFQRHFTVIKKNKEIETFPTENKTNCMLTFRCIHLLSGVPPLVTHGTLEYTC